MSFMLELPTYVTRYNYLLVTLSMHMFLETLVVAIGPKHSPCPAINTEIDYV